MGSESDAELLKKAESQLAAFGVDYETNVLSAHRKPEALVAYVRDADARGAGVFICAAGMAAALPGVVAGEPEPETEEETPVSEAEQVKPAEPLPAADEHAIVELLGSIGTSEEEIERARQESPSALFALAADRLIVPGTERLTRKEV